MMRSSVSRLRQLHNHVAGDAEAATTVDQKEEILSARALAARKDPATAMKAALDSGKIPDMSVGEDGAKLSEKLPGPLQDRDKAEILLEIGKAEMDGTNHSQWMEWQEQYGDVGLESNIVIPHIVRERVGAEVRSWYTEKVMLSDPDDCIRIARAHTRKQPNFQLFMGDSVISATDDKVWKEQRNHLTEAFLPTSSLAEIFPTSVERAEACAEILKRLSQGGTQKVNMTEFFLNETQQQLHLALFGQQDESFDEDYNAMFRDSIGGPPGDDRYQERHGMAQQRAVEMEEQGRAGAHAFETMARDGFGAAEATDKDAHTSRFLKDLNTFIRKNADTFAAPTDVAADPSKKIAGPLSAVLAKQLDKVNSAQTMGEAYEALDDRLKGMLNGSSNLGNAFIFAFAGHDTTGHTLTWLTYELAKHPHYQQRLVDEVDAFWEECGDRELEFLDMKKLPFLTRCVMETLRLWPVVPNGTFRQLSYDDKIKGPGGEMVHLPKGTYVQVTTAGRHRSTELWGDDANEFNPDREFEDDELWHDQVYAARNPHSRRFSPFTHTPRDCIGKNFAQMEMRTILTQLFKNFTFELTEEEKAAAAEHGTDMARGKNAGTLGPLDVDFDMPHNPYGMHVYAIPRNLEAAKWDTPIDWPASRGVVPDAATLK
jgi:cytochrome P450